MSSEKAVAVLFGKPQTGNLLVPFAMLAINDGAYRTYDIENSRQYGFIYHLSASGFQVMEVDRPYWCEDEKYVERKKGARRIQMPKRFLTRGQDFVNWLHNDGVDSGAEYCEECQDWYPEDDTCYHIWWCGKIGTFSTPSERFKCNCEDCQRARECLRLSRNRLLKRSKGRSYE